MSTITIVYGDDWDGLYVDGVLALENHSLGVRKVLEALKGYAVDEVSYLNADEEWLGFRGHLPIQLKDVKVKP